MHERLADALSAQGKDEEALAAILSAQGSFPRVLDATYCWHLEAKANMLLKLKRDEEAIAVLQQATKLAPYRPYAFKWQSVPLFRLKRYKESLASLQRSLEVDPDDHSVIYWIPPSEAASCPDLEFRDGLMQLADNLDLSATTPRSIWIQRGALRAEFGRFRDAQSDLAKGIELGDSSTLTLKKHAVLCLANNDVESYRATCQQALKSRTPGDAVALAMLGSGAVDDYGIIVELASQRLSEQPSNPDRMSVLGATFFRAGRYSEAVDQLSTADASTGLSQDFRVKGRLFLAMATARLERVDEARYWLQQVEADSTIPGHGFGTAVTPSTEPWHRRLSTQLLLKETVSLLARNSAHTSSSER